MDTLLTKAELKILKTTYKLNELDVSIFKQNNKEFNRLIQLKNIFPCKHTYNENNRKVYTHIQITQQGKALVENLKAKKRTKIIEYVRYSITTAIAVGAFIVSLIALSKK